MMVLDPLSALSVSAAVLQFIHFSCTVIGKAHEYQHSVNGSLAKNAELQNIATRFIALNQGLLKAASPKVLAQFTANEAAFQNITRQCQQAAREFIDTLELLTINGSSTKWKSFRQALKAQWGKDRIDAMSQNLKQLREEWVVHLLVVMSDRQLKMLSTLDNMTGATTDNTRMEMNILSAIKDLNHQLPVKDEVATISARFDDIAEDEDRTVHEEYRGRFRQMMLDTLYHPVISERQSDVATAHAETFKWVYNTDNCSSDSQKWSNFADWLENDSTDNRIYWISGKAGSGKSTLMKFLLQHEQTAYHLRNWSKEKDLLTASCFFWNAGTQLQKSQQGLLRTILWSILSQAPTMIEQVFSWQWRRYCGNMGMRDIYTKTELIEAFKTLAQLKSAPNIFLFIDGLDEYDAASGESINVLHIIKDLSHSHNIKLCLSSRPWPIFQDAFKDMPTLCLQDLTRDDIKKYVKSTLEENSLFLKLKTIDAHESAIFVHEIVDKAYGVFLWVFLVVRSLLEGLGNDDGIEDLRRRLAQVPVELKEYFDFMFKRLDPFYLAQARRLFQLALQPSCRQTLMTFSFINDEDLEAILESAYRPFSQDEIVSRHRTMTRRLDVCCKGLLEVQFRSFIGNPEERTQTFDSYDVTFLHRTVRDYLLEKDAEGLNILATSADFNIYKTLCNATLAQMKRMPLERLFTNDEDSFANHLLRRFTEEIIDYARESQKEKKVPLVESIEMLDKIVPEYMVAQNQQLKSVLCKKHWTNWMDPNGCRADSVWTFRYPSSYNSMLSYAITQKLYEYVRLELGRSLRQREKTAYPLVGHVLGLRFTERHTGLHYHRMLALLLEHGADTNEEWRNEKWGKFTIWHHHLIRLNNIGMKFENSIYDSAYSDTEALIDHGASNSLRIRIDGKNHMILTLRDPKTGLMNKPRKGRIVSPAEWLALFPEGEGIELAKKLERYQGRHSKEA